MAQEKSPDHLRGNVAKRPEDLEFKITNAEKYRVELEPKKTFVDRLRLHKEMLELKGYDLNKYMVTAYAEPDGTRVVFELKNDRR